MNNCFEYTLNVILHFNYLAKIELSQESRYSVISVKPYKAMTSDELDFPKEKKFEVVGQETKRWLIGEIGRKKGFFPAEYVKVKFV